MMREDSAPHRGDRHPSRIGPLNNSARARLRGDGGMSRGSRAQRLSDASGERVSPVTGETPTDTGS